MKYNLLCLKIFDRLIISFTKHDYEVSTSFIQEKKRYKCLKTGKWISIRLLVPGLLLTVRSARVDSDLKLQLIYLPEWINSNPLSGLGKGRENSRPFSTQSGIRAYELKVRLWHCQI